jgi:hypothetical protein
MFSMVTGLDLARAPRRALLTVRKKGSGYENGLLSNIHPRTYIFLRYWYEVVFLIEHECKCNILLIV